MDRAKKVVGGILFGAFVFVIGFFDLLSFSQEAAEEAEKRPTTTLFKPVPSLPDYNPLPIIPYVTTTRPAVTSVTLTPAMGDLLVNLTRRSSEEQFPADVTWVDRVSDEELVSFANRVCIAKNAGGSMEEYSAAAYTDLGSSISEIDAFMLDVFIYLAWDAC